MSVIFLLPATTEHVKSFKEKSVVSWSVIILDVAAQAFLTVGVFASLYAGFIAPEFGVRRRRRPSAL